MKFLERDLEDIIFNNNNDKLQEKGLDIGGKKYRQLRIGNYGIADMVTIERGFDDCEDGCLFINIYELKKDIIDVNAFIQAIGYMKGISSFLKSRDFNFNYRFTITLVSKNISKEGNFIYLTDFIKPNSNENDLMQLVFYTYNYGIDGIEFKTELGYDLVNKGF